MMVQTANTIDQRKLTELLSILKLNNITLSSHNGRVRYEAPESAITPDFIDGLRTFKFTLLKMLEANVLNLDVVVPLNQASNVKAYVICIHTGHGGVMDYRFFAKHMSSEYGIYGIQAFGFLKEQQGELSVEKLAKVYVDIIMSRFTDAPIVLYGISAGGLISLEMARLLAEMNQPPRLIVLGDTLDMAIEELEHKSYLQRMQWINFIEAYLPVEILAISSNGSKLWALNSEGHEFWQLNERRRFEYLIDKSHQLNHKRKIVELNVDDMSAHFKSHGALTKAYFYYRPKPYNGLSLFVKATETDWNKSNNIREKFTGNFRVKEIEGAHIDIIHNPGCEKVAQFIMSYFK